MGRACCSNKIMGAPVIRKIGWFMFKVPVLADINPSVSFFSKTVTTNLPMKKATPMGVIIIGGVNVEMHVI